MRIAIVDDLAAERTLLKGRLEWQLQRRKVQADILEYESGETFLEAARSSTIAILMQVSLLVLKFQDNYITACRG